MSQKIAAVSRETKKPKQETRQRWWFLHLALRHLGSSTLPRRCRQAQVETSDGAAGPKVTRIACRRDPDRFLRAPCRLKNGWDAPSRVDATTPRLDIDGIMNRIS